VPASPQKQRDLEHIGRTFIAGYSAALAILNIQELADELNRFDAERRGFAFEGAAMALALTDTLFGQKRFSAMLAGAGARHLYMMHVGYGWAVARLPWKRRNIAGVLKQHDSLLGSLIVDGYGFHEGYFHWRSSIVQAEAPSRLDARSARVFDQGLGRSLWFFSGADPKRTADCIGHFPRRRHGDLWSGVGLASTYAGAASGAELACLRLAAGPCAPHLGQGAAFAATARDAAGNSLPYTDTAVRVFCDRSAVDVVTLTHAALGSENVQSADDRYEAWRAEIRKRLWSPSGRPAVPVPMPIGGAGL
jgi:enediyne biosynthesis protein E3